MNCTEHRSAPAHTRSGAGLVVIYVVAFALFLDNHSLAPVIAPYATSLGASVAVAGVIVGAFSAVNLFSNLGAGYVIDRIGRKLPLLTGLALMGAALLLYPLAAEPGRLLVLRMVHGFGAGLASPTCLAYLADTAAPASRGRTMAVYGAASGLAGLMGPPLAGLLRDRLGYGAVFGLVAALLLLLVIPASRLVAESLPTATERVRGGVQRVLSNRRLQLAYASAFCWMFSLGTLLVFLPLRGQASGLSSMRIGLLFGSFAAAATIIQASPLGRASDRWGRERTIILGFVLAGLALVILPLLSGWPALMAGMFGYGTGFGFIFPAMTALIADEAEARTRGTAAGIFMAVFSLGMAAGTASAGALTWLQQTIHLHPFQFAALLMLLDVALAAFVWLTRQRR